MSDIIQSDYEQLEGIARRFEQSEETTAATLKGLRERAEALRETWKGSASARFQAEMGGEVLPALQRLTEAFGHAATTTREIARIFSEAEKEAAALFRGEGDGGGGGGFWSGVGDFFSGMWAEGKDMITGIVSFVTDPVGSLQGLWYGITHPGELWEAIKAPYVEDWNNGRPWRAIGRGVMAIGTTLLGTKGADKAAAAAKASRAARVAGDAAEVAGRLGTPVRAAETLGTVARGSRGEAALSRYIAGESTHIVGTGERVVLGAYRSNPARGFPGYIGEATANGGRYYSTPAGVWDNLHPPSPRVPTTYEGTLVNREFLRSQMEARVPRIELHGESIAEVLTDPRRRTSYTADEIHYMQRYAYEYGYRQVGDTWVRTGDWRASTGGRVIGGSTGPAIIIGGDAGTLPRDDGR